jgi:hypothetical protein
MLNEADYEYNVLSLLRYSLGKKNVPEYAYYIGDEGDENHQHDKLCLLKDKQDQWIVLYAERGNISQKIVHPFIREAMIDFYWKLTRKDTPWDFREKWETETGLSF